MSRNLSIVLLIAAAVVALVRATSPTARAAPAPGAPAAELKAYTLGSEAGEAFWWMHQGEVSSAVVWFGPMERLPSGPAVRRWVAVASLPGDSRPLSAFHSAVRLDSSESIGLGSETYSVRLAPRDGLLWGDVSDARDLEALAEGLF